MTGRVTITVTVESDVELRRELQDGSISNAMNMAKDMAVTAFTETLARAGVRVVSTIVPKRALILGDEQEG